jgi:hypothetical protein
MKYFKIFLIFLNLAFLSFTIFLFVIDGNYNQNPLSHPDYVPQSSSIGEGIEWLFRIGIRTISFIIVGLTLIYYFQKKKSITIIHLIITSLTIGTTFLYT